MSAVLSIIAGFASALSGGLWDLMAVIGCIITGSIALLVLWCLIATHGQRREPLRVVIVPDVGDDTLAMLCRCCRGDGDDCRCATDCGAPRCQAADPDEAIARTECSWRAQQESGRA